MAFNVKVNYKRDRNAVNPRVWEGEAEPVFVWVNAVRN